MDAVRANGFKRRSVPLRLGPLLKRRSPPELSSEDAVTPGAPRAMTHSVARTDIPPEHVEVHLRIAPDGRLLNVVAQRRGEATKGTFAYLPFGVDIHAERHFGDLVIPSRVTAGWN